MKLVAAMVLMIAAVPASAADQVIPRPFADAWRASLQTLAIDGMQIVSSDRDAGLIQAKGSFADHPEWFACGHGGGVLSAQDFTLTVIVTAATSGSKIQLRADGKQTWVRYYHALWIKVGRKSANVVCTSTGKLEQQFLARISEI